MKPEHIVIRFLADESLEYSLVLYLRKQGYDIASIAEGSPSISDEEVLTKANAENRVIITNDKDFGDLVFMHKLEHSGVILFRFKRESVNEKIKAINSLLRFHKEELVDHFIVVDESTVRVRA